MQLIGLGHDLSTCYSVRVAATGLGGLLPRTCAISFTICILAIDRFAAVSSSSASSKYCPAIADAEEFCSAHALAVRWMEGSSRN